MKTLFKTILLMVVALTSVALVSCNDDEDNSAPEVKYVRMTNSASSDSLVTSASLGAVIAIVGNHLGNVTQIYFNNQTASLNPTYITDHTILVSVPTGIPATDSITNTIRLITRTGLSTTYDFVTEVPTPVLTSINNEYAQIGDTVTITGNYFVSPTVKFTPDIEAKVVSSTLKQLKVVVPQGAEAGAVTVTSLYGSTVSTKFIYHDNADVTSTTKFITDFEDKSWDTWGYGHYGTTGGTSGQYYIFNGTAGSWNWNTSLALMYVNPNKTTIVNISDVSEYALRFEVNSIQWYDTPMVMWFSKDETFSTDDDNAQYHWKPYLTDGVTSDYVTKGWTTVTIPLSSFNTDKAETTTSRVLNPSDLVNFHIFYFGSMTTSTNPTGVNVEIDNLRIVKYDK